MSRPQIAYLFNLLQDVNILRPVVRLAAAEFDASALFLLTAKFLERDAQGVWQSELEELRAETGAALSVYGSEYEAVQALAGRRGMVFAASESNLPAHAETHRVMLAAPPGYLKVTLQHGLECIGFLQNRDHTKAHGRNITFAADVICGWCDLPRMTAVSASERAKYWATGPSALIEPAPPRPADARPGPGLVCENLHSVRLRASGDFRESFMDSFGEFCAELGARGEPVRLRPHPGGQYVVKNNVPLAANVSLETRPMYKLDLRDCAWGISAPSSVLVDMVLAGIPTAVWQDEQAVVDATQYEGLTTISALPDWLAFHRDVALRPEVFAQRQAAWLARSGLIADVASVRSRYARLLAGGLAAACA
ncbi:MAG: hypothetical protein ING89_15365 [Rubrivivax sp.]|nr:hypothetical protein [Rubrivivax sp.]